MGITSETFSLIGGSSIKLNDWVIDEKCRVDSIGYMVRRAWKGMQVTLCKLFMLFSVRSWLHKKQKSLCKNNLLMCQRIHRTSVRDHEDGGALRA